MPLQVGVACILNFMYNYRYTVYTFVLCIESIMNLFFFFYNSPFVSKKQMLRFTHLYVILTNICIDYYNGLGCICSILNEKERKKFFRALFPKWLGLT